MGELDTVSINKSSIWKYAALILLVGVIVVFFVKSNTSQYNAKIIDDGSSQSITIGYKNYNYYPNTIRVKVNEPVTITLDESVSGCFREFVIPDFGVDEVSNNPSDTITFTPDKKGTFVFRCGMGMGNGIMIVE